MLYHAKFPWIAQLCSDSDSATLLLADAFPDVNSEALLEKAKAVQRWRQQSALAGHKLVPVTSAMPQNSAMRTVEAIIGAISCSPVKTCELHSVKPELLLAPLPEGVTTPLAAQSLSVGDWVACMSANGGTTPPFGAYGVVVAVHDGFADIRTLEKFAGGSDLDGRVQKGYGSRLPLRVLLSLTTIRSPDSSQLEPPAVSTRASVSQARSPARGASGAVPFAAVAEPAVPDGTRGFHHHTGHGRGKPVQQPSAKATIASLAGPQQPEQSPQTAPPATANGTKNGTEVPAFFQKLLAAPTVRHVDALQAPAARELPAARIAGQDTQNSADMAAAAHAPPAVPDFLQKLLGGPQTKSTQEPQPEIRAPMPQAQMHPGQTTGHSNESSVLQTPPSQAPGKVVPSAGAAHVPASIAETTAALPVATSVAVSASNAYPCVQRLFPPSHEDFAKMTRQQQMQIALQSMKDLISALQSFPRASTSEGRSTLADVLAKVRILLLPELMCGTQFEDLLLMFVKHMLTSHVLSCAGSDHPESFAGHDQFC